MNAHVPNRTPIHSNLDAALRLAKAGISIFICRNVPGDKKQDKTPLGVKSWKAESTTDESRIRAWFQKYPDAIIGIDCGKSGLVVIDPDRHDNGFDGVANFDALVDENGGLPEYPPMTLTAGNGQHHYFRQPEGGRPIGTSEGSLPRGINVRGAGGYVIAQGSMRADGVAGWRPAGSGHPDLVEAYAAGTIPVLPDWLANIIRTKPEKVERPQETQPEQPMSVRTHANGPLPAGSADVLRRGTIMAEKELAKYVANISAMGRETGRNNALNNAALDMGHMIAAGYIGERAVRADLTGAMHANGYVASDGIDAVRKTLDSGISKGKTDPHKGFADRPMEREEDREIEALAEAIGRMIDKEYEERKTTTIDGVLVDAETGEIIEVNEPEQEENEQEADAEPSGPDFADAILERHGLVSDIAHWILSVSRRPQKRFAVASALAVVATAASRQLQTPTFANVNLFITMIGQSGSGKDAPMKATTELLMKSSLPELIGPDGFQSDSAVYDKVNKHPVCLAAVNEFGDYLAAATAKHAPAHISRVLAVLRKMYDGGTISSPHGVGRQSVHLNNPCLSILGAATPKQFYGAIGDAQAENGTLNRFIAVTVPGHVQKADTFASTSDVPANLKDWLLELADRPGGATWWRYRVPEDAQDENGPLFSADDIKPEAVPWTDEAKRLWNDYEDEVNLRIAGNPHIDNFAARCPLNTLRVATVLAIGENIGEPEVDAVHIEIGKSMVEASLRDMMRGFDEHGEETPESRLGNRIKRIIASKGGVIGRNQLMRSVQRHIRNAKALDDALNVLWEAREIIPEDAKPGENGGRPGKKYRLRH